MHKLLYARVSPFSRKARVTSIEKKIESSIELIECAPFESPDLLLSANPLSKVPVLIMANGTSLYDSSCICEYLDSIGSGSRLIPSENAKKWGVLKGQALADGLTDAAVLVVLEQRRPESERSQKWADRQMAVIRRSLAYFEKEIEARAEELTIDQIALACALGYLEFRLPNYDWKGAHPNLNRWNSRFQERPSMLATKHPCARA